MISLEHVTYKVDNRTILDDISLTIEPNKITYIIGKNGSGKSTLANIISGLIKCSGKVFIDNLEITNKTNNKVLRKKVGMVFQNPSNQIIFSKVYDDIKFILDNMHIPKDKIDHIIKSSLTKVRMEDFINSNPYNLSGGEKQKIAIAGMLSLDPDYLIFDESTSMLDINSKKEIYNLLKKLKKNMGIIFITNNMDELIYADDVVILDNKKVYKYPLKEIIHNNKILTDHNLEIPFIFKIMNKLGIKKISSEEDILSKL